MCVCTMKQLFQSLLEVSQECSPCSLPDVETLEREFCSVQSRSKAVWETVMVDTAVIVVWGKHCGQGKHIHFLSNCIFQ